MQSSCTRWTPTRATWRRAAARPSGKNLTNSAAAGVFFPQTKSLGIDRTCFSPAVQAKIVYAGSRNTSYPEAADNLRELMNLAISDKEVRRVYNVFAAALTGREFADGWAWYVRWIAAVWQVPRGRGDRRR